MQIKTQSDAGDPEDRPLVDDELDEVNGGLFVLVADAILAFEAGFLASRVAPRPTKHGDAPGEV
jgi:hypothetical protein